MSKTAVFEAAEESASLSTSAIYTEKNMKNGKSQKQIQRGGEVR